MQERLIMGKGSKARPYTDKKSFYSNWDDIDWDNKKEEVSAAAPAPDKINKLPFGNDIEYYEDRN